MTHWHRIIPTITYCVTFWTLKQKCRVFVQFTFIPTKHSHMTGFLIWNEKNKDTFTEICFFKLNPYLQIRCIRLTYFQCNIVHVHYIFKILRIKLTKMTQQAISDWPGDVYYVDAPDFTFYLQCIHVFFTYRPWHI